MTERPESLGLKVLYEGSNPSVESVSDPKGGETVGIDNWLSQYRCSPWPWRYSGLGMD